MSSEFHDYTISPQGIVTTNISFLIAKTQRALKAEENYPSLSGDEMDRKIVRLRKRLEKLENIRADFEDVMSEVTGGL